MARTAPLAGEPVRPADELCTIIYTSGTTGRPKGVMHSFGTLAFAVQTGLTRVPLTADTRMLSYLPLAHVVERALVEHGQLSRGFRRPCCTSCRRRNSTCCSGCPSSAVS